MIMETFENSRSLKNLKADEESLSEKVDSSVTINSKCKIAPYCWKITDTDEDLINLHYNDRDPKIKPIMNETYLTTTITEYVPICQNLRGIVIDTKEDSIVAASSIYTPLVNSKQFHDYMETPDEKFDFIDPNPEKNHYYLVMQGTILRCFCHSGKRYLASNKRLNVNKSRWGSSKTFSEMYIENGGPYLDVLFPKGTINSKFCYVFMVVTDETLICSKMKLGSEFKRNGFIVHLGTINMSYYNPWEVNYDDNDREYLIETSDVFDYLDGKTENSIVRPKELDYKSAMTYLRYGEIIHSDGRIDDMSGEAILVSKNKFHVSDKMLKVCSDGYLIRTMLRNGDPNAYHVWYTMNDRVEEFVVNYILEHLSDTVVPQDNFTKLMENFDPYSMISAYCLPLTQISKIYDFPKRRDDEFDECIKWFSGLKISDYEDQVPGFVKEAFDYHLKTGSKHSIEDSFIATLENKSEKEIYKAVQLAKKMKLNN